MSIVVNAPTSNIGRRAALRLLEAGEKVTVLSRDEKKVQDLAQRGARVIAGSYEDPALLGAALEGARGLFWLTPPPARPDFYEWAQETARRAASLARKAKAERVVVISSIGAHSGPGSGPVGILRAVEDAFEESLPHVVSLRAGFFMENFLRSVDTIAKARSIFLPALAAKRQPMVATKDIADRAACWLLDRGWKGHHRVGVHGPVDHSPEEAAAIIGRALGEPVKYVEVTLDQARQAMKGLGMPDWMVEIYIELYGAMRDGRLDPAEPRTPETTTPTSLVEFTRETLRPALEAAR